MKQIVLVIDGFKPGGAQQVYLLLIKEYLKKFNSVILISINPEDNDLKLPTAKNFESYNLQAKHIFKIDTFLKFKKIISNLEPEFILASMYGSQVLSALFKPKKTKLIWIEQNTYTGRSAFHWSIMRVLKARVLKIICVSEKVLEITKKNLGGNTVQLPNPINFPNIEFSHNRANDFVFVGRMVEQKNPALAIESFKLFFDKFKSDSKLHLIGDGELLNDLISYSRELGIFKNCVFHGFTDIANTISILSKSKVLISTSRIEGFGLARLEALAIGCCVISTDTGGVGDYLSLSTDLGLFLAKSDPEVIANLMSRALQTKYWNTQMVTSRIGLTSAFSPKIVSEQWLSEKF
jgi:glycosyltransferase involved in cell wall biosynthesis